MLWYTHLAFGFLTGLISLQFFRHGNIYIFFAFALLGALLPDIDTPNSKIGSKLGIFSRAIKFMFGHRGVIHTVWGMTAICGVFWYFVNRTYGTALFLGFLSHLIIDGFTKKGINFTHPIASLHMSGFIESGSASEKILLAIIGALIIILLI